MTTDTNTDTKDAELVPDTSIARIAAAVDPHPEGRDAATLAATLADATGADLALLTIEPDLPLIVPGFDWKRVRRQTEAMLSETQNSLTHPARTMIDTDLSIARGIERGVRRGDRDLLVVGSSRKAPVGAVCIGKRTRQLLHLLECPLVVAARGLSSQPEFRLRRIGVGYDGGPEAKAALAAAAALASGSGAEIRLLAIADDRLPSVGLHAAWAASLEPSWDELMQRELASLERSCKIAADQLDGPIDFEVRRGRPATALHELSDELDLLAIGSRRWGPAARVLLGGTGEALLHGARCSMMIAPRVR